MRLFSILIAALVTALIASGRLPVDRLPGEVGGMPTSMVLFLLVVLMVLAVFAATGRSRRL